MSPILMLMMLVGVAVAFPYPNNAPVPADVVAPVEDGPAPGEEKVDERFFLLRPTYGGHGHGYGHHHHGGYNSGYGNHYNGYGGYGGYGGQGGYGNYGGLHWREGQKAGEGAPDAAAVPIDAAAAAPANGQVTFE
ncbi:uncharacterized protein LOC130692820 [Daphnia carinata]|uniref:uncharacterized protein LOC130692820 n=1 Tax=Daphnia carinata TaxID=120202 RepID=UPI00258030F1|nr:uncharacterized protein LOC130692820 [Daphnia carinata]